MLARLLSFAAVIFFSWSSTALAAPNFKAPYPCNQTYSYYHHSSEVRQALDFNAPYGTPVLASAAGYATRYYEAGGAGNYIVIDHGGGWKTYYFHLDSFSVANGTTVSQGQKIGVTGNTGNSFGAHIHYEQLLNGVGQVIYINGRSLAPYPSGSGVASLTSDNGCGGNPPPTGQYWVDTFANAPGYGSPTSTTQTGTLYAGTNYVFCKAWGREVRNGDSFNHWWLKTDLDVGPAGQWISAYYLSRWGNDEAKDNNGNVIPDCAPPAASKYWVDTFDNAPGYASPTSTTQTGTLNAGTNYVFCKAWGRQIGSGSSYNHWWLKTDLDTGPAGQWVSAYYLSRWGNDEAKDNNGAVIPDC
ncbi:M23 family metallopeptidase [Luteimonas panaciterrae]|uniref:M23 family metallopeptidase n=1 Tax=Luteimonas panaciterrae TaxID=363885 RepID=UPI001CFAD974|nr:M23 family metallopeptidase [Luteimonas panaciterrae]